VFVSARRVPGVARVLRPGRRYSGPRAGPVTIARVSTRYRCGACGNLTRFDVLASRRTRAFHHYSIGGELTVEEEDVLEDRIEQVTCRWCGATGDAIEQVPVDAGPIEELA
jgi:hypothetical protein